MRSEKLWHVNHDPFTLCLPHSVGWTQYFPPVQANYIAICIPRFQLESSKESTFHAGETGDVGSIPGERILVGYSHPWVIVSLFNAITPQKHHQRLHTAGVEWSGDFSIITDLLINIFAWFSH